MHDWWCALVLGALGETIFDPEPSLYYRQHSGNAVGGARGFAQHAVRLGRKFLRDPRAFHPIHGQAADLLQAVGGATAPAKRSAIQTLVESRNSLRTRIAYAFSPQVKRTRLVDRIVMRSLIAFGLY